MSETIQLTTGGTIEWFHADTPNKKYMLYFHGGGLVYGSKSDLPKQLKQLFLDKGFSVITVDYRLAPNNTLSEISSGVVQSFYSIHELIGQQPFSFCGRSAGSYLMMLLTSHLIDQKTAALPEQLINFYGYTDLDFINMKRSLSDVLVTEAQLQSVEMAIPVWDDPLLQRYLLYIYAVQNQKLADYYGLTEQNRPKLTISREKLQQFPPLFSTASTTDQEIPFKYSKRLVRKNTQDLFVPVYDLPHDFLKETQDKQVINVMDRLALWLT